MHFSTVASAALALLASSVSADFIVYIGGSTDISEGGSFATSDVYMFNHPPSCADGNNAVPIVNGQGGANDASHNGFACDGCDPRQSPGSWDVTRLEIYDGNNSPVTNEGLGHLTMYETAAGSGQWNIVWVSLDGKSSGNKGTCSKPSSPNTLQCTTGLGNISAVELMVCTTELKSVVGPA